jgi:hypothetical protein
MDAMLASYCKTGVAGTDHGGGRQCAAATPGQAILLHFRPARRSSLVEEAVPSRANDGGSNFDRGAHQFSAAVIFSSKSPSLKGF